MFATTLYKMHFCAIIPLQRNTHTRSLMDRTMPSDGINVGSTPAECTNQSIRRTGKFFRVRLIFLEKLLTKVLNSSTM